MQLWWWLKRELNLKPSAAHKDGLMEWILCCASHGLLIAWDLCDLTKHRMGTLTGRRASPREHCY